MKEELWFPGEGIADGTRGVDDYLCCLIMRVRGCGKKMRGV